jgi:hypothetical protein
MPYKENADYSDATDKTELTQKPHGESARTDEAPSQRNRDNNFFSDSEF